MYQMFWGRLDLFFLCPHVSATIIYKNPLRKNKPEMTPGARIKKLLSSIEKMASKILILKVFFVSHCNGTTVFGNWNF